MSEIGEAARRAQLEGISSHSRRAGYGHRRARRQALRRAEAAPRDRAHVLEESADPHPGRGDLRARHGDGGGDPAVAGRAVARPHDAGHRPPAGDDQECRPHRRRDGAGIAEQGAHEELIAVGGVYSRLHQAQFSS